MYKFETLKWYNPRGKNMKIRKTIDGKTKVFDIEKIAKEACEKVSALGEIFGVEDLAEILKEHVEYYRDIELI